MKALVSLMVLGTVCLGFVTASGFQRGGVFQRQQLPGFRQRSPFMANGLPISLKVDGVERTALVFAPANAKGTSSPLVFCWHGHGGGSRQASMSFRIHKEWPEAVVVYPQGLPTKGKTDPEGKKPGWQQGPNDEGGRDLKYFDALLSHLKRAYKIDAKRIFTMGHSNGGRFTYLLWAERGDVFAAYGPSGSPAIGLGRTFKPASAFHVAGEKDQIVPFAGQKLTIEGIKMLDGIGGSDKGESDGYVTTYRGSGGLELVTYIHPGGHNYPAQVPALLVQFFKRRERGK
ncbi:MAG: esterase [Armatimonadetes bacterium]|nr:esterase [Armatimonadota bacterium]